MIDFLRLNLSLAVGAAAGAGTFYLLILLHDPGPAAGVAWLAYVVAGAIAATLAVRLALALFGRVLDR